LNPECVYKRVAVVREQEQDFGDPIETQPDTCIMKTKLTLFVAVLAAALFGMGCASTEPAFVSDGLVAYYPFNGNAKDESGTGNDGTVNGAVLRTDRHGASNKAYQFDGLDDYINIPNHPSLEIPTGGLTISAWIYQKGAGEGNTVLTKGNAAAKPNTYDYALVASTSNNRIRYAWITDGGKHNDVSSGDGAYQVGMWQHVAVVHVSGSTIEFYANGIQVHTVSNSATRDLGGDELRIGRQTANHGGSFDGLIDDIRIYKSALSADEVKALYDLEKPKTK